MIDNHLNDHLLTFNLFFLFLFQFQPLSHNLPHHQLPLFSNLTSLENLKITDYFLLLLKKKKKAKQVTQITSNLFALNSRTRETLTLNNSSRRDARIIESGGGGGWKDLERFRNPTILDRGYTPPPSRRIDDEKRSWRQGFSLAATQRNSSSL